MAPSEMKRSFLLKNRSRRKWISKLRTGRCIYIYIYIFYLEKFRECHAAQINLSSLNEICTFFTTVNYIKNLSSVLTVRETLSQHEKFKLVPLSTESTLFFFFCFQELFLEEINFHLFFSLPFFFLFFFCALDK